MKRNSARNEQQTTRRRNVLVPVDFSTASENALAKTVELLGQNGRIILVHVVPRPIHNGHTLRGSMKIARKKLENFFGSAHLIEPRRIRLIVRAGTPFHEILGAAKDHKANLIVLGIDDSDPVGGLALGHTADRVSRYAWCSVLLVRTDHKGFP
jgi:universal stress protein A